MRNTIDYIHSLKSFVCGDEYNFIRRFMGKGFKVSVDIISEPIFPYHKGPAWV